MEKDSLVDVAGDYVVFNRVEGTSEEPRRQKITVMLNDGGTIAQCRGTCGVRADLIALDEVAVAGEGRSTDDDAVGAVARDHVTAARAYPADRIGRCMTDRNSETRPLAAAVPVASVLTVPF